MRLPNYTFYLHQGEDFSYGYDNESNFSAGIPVHMHDGWELLYVKRGELSYAVEGKTFPISPGNLIITRPGSVHALYANGTVHYERHCLVVAGDLLPQEIIEQIPSDLHVLDLSNNPIISELYERIDFYRAKLQEHLLASTLRGIIHELWMNIYICMPTPIQPAVSTSNPVITKAIEFIKAHVREPLTVEQVSSALFISPRYLHQCFAKTMNIPPKQYIMLQKLQQVRQALIAGANPTDICSDYSFQSYSTFYRNYQKIYGCRPSDTPRQSLQKIDL